MPSNHLMLRQPLLLLPSTFSSIKVFSNESALSIRWPKCWHFSFNISPFNEHPGLMTFRINYLNLLAVQGTLKNLLQHHSSKASVPRCSAFFIVQLSHPSISSSVSPFSCLQSFPASGSFPMSQFFESGGQHIGVSASVSILPMNIQDWSPLGWIGWISLQSKGLSRVSFSTTVQKHQFFSTQPTLWSNSHICTWRLEKP